MGPKIPSQLNQKRGLTICPECDTSQNQSGANHEFVSDESPFSCAALQNGSSISQISAWSPLLLHRRVFRFSLTRTSARDRMILRFRRLRRDSRSVDQGQFLLQLSSALSAKRAVRPRLGFLRSRGASASAR